MKEAIEARELITLDGVGGFGVAVRGTYHKVCDDDPGQAHPVRPDRVGVLFLNSLSPTRAAAGDSAVYWADSCARSGYPAFRVDMPGFGDSDGNPPPELLKFINNGGYGSLGSEMAAELSARFGLLGVVIVGLCAGAVSALYTAAASKECVGLVLMDPYFHLPIPEPPWLWQKLTGRISRTAPGRFVSAIYDRLGDLRSYLRRNPIPANANFPLLSCWETLAAAGLPILIFKAPNVKPRGVEFDYLRHLLDQAGENNQIVVKVIEGTGHTFSNRVGQTAVGHHTERWLNAFFPLASAEVERQSFSTEPKDAKLQSLPLVLLAPVTSASESRQSTYGRSV